MATVTTNLALDEFYLCSFVSHNCCQKKNKYKNKNIPLSHNAALGDTALNHH